MPGFGLGLRPTGRRQLRRQADEVDYFAWTPNIAVTNDGSLSDSGGFDFTKTANVDSWDALVYSSEAVAGDFEISWTVADTTNAALSAVGVIDAVPAPNGSNFNAMDHGLYMQSGLAFRHLDNATPYDTLLSGLQVGDRVTIARVGDDLVASSFPARAGSPLTIKTGVSGVAFRAVAYINRVGHEIVDLGFGPLA